MWKSTEDKKRRAAIFEDTMQLIKESELLSGAVVKSKNNTKFYSESDYPDIKPLGRDCMITFSGERTYESAVRLIDENPGKRVAVLNFASAVNPGGSAKYGMASQEESLCRTSTLYPLLNTAELKRLYYTPNKESGNNLHTDAVIYTPDVVICKSDTAFPERIPESEYKTVDVLTCAAPNLNERYTKRYSGDNPMERIVPPEEQYSLHLKRCRHILSVAAANGVDILVLGAFGCGAFKNDCMSVARAMTDACKEYKEYFDIIHFAVVKKKKVNENYRVFADVINLL